MSRRVQLLVVIALCASVAAPSLGWASSGGAGLGTTGGSSPGSPAPSGSSSSPSGVRPGNVMVRATSDGLTLATRASALLRNGLTFTGSAPATDSGKEITIERLGHETGWNWVSTVTTKITRHGTFSAVWHTNHIGRFSIRAVFASGAAAAAAPPTVTITVYRPSLATMYGPGFWGQRTACGQRLERSTIGVANRTLKCGEKVAIYYRGKTIVLPVIDRGPYANGADWDLTEATDKVLGIPGTATIGAVSLPPAPSAN